MSSVTVLRARRLCGDALDPRALLSDRGIGIVCQSCRVGHDDGERRLELMARVRDKALLVFPGALDRARREARQEHGNREDGEHEHRPQRHEHSEGLEQLDFRSARRSQTRCGSSCCWWRAGNRARSRQALPLSAPSASVAVTTSCSVSLSSMTAVEDASVTM